MSEEKKTEEQIVNPMKVMADVLAPHILKHIEGLDWTEHIDIDSIYQSVLDSLDEDSIIENAGRRAAEQVSENLDIDDQVDERIEYVVDDSFISDRIDYYDIGQNLDFSDIADEVKDYIDEPEIDASDVSDAMQEAINNGCSAVDDMCLKVLERARDSDEHGDEFVVIRADEYSRLMKALDFIESTFNIPEPTDDSPRTIAVNLVKDNWQNSGYIQGEMQQQRIEVIKQLNRMKKTELVAWAEAHGYRTDGLNIAQILELVGA